MEKKYQTLLNIFVFLVLSTGYIFIDSVEGVFTKNIPTAITFILTFAISALVLANKKLSSFGTMITWGIVIALGLGIATIFH